MIWGHISEKNLKILVERHCLNYWSLRSQFILSRCCFRYALCCPVKGRKVCKRFEKFCKTHNLFLYLLFKLGTRLHTSIRSVAEYVCYVKALLSLSKTTWYFFASLHCHRFLIESWALLNYGILVRGIYLSYFFNLYFRENFVLTLKNPDLNVPLFFLYLYIKTAPSE